MPRWNWPAHDVPVVATNDVRFLLREDFEAHEVRVCIHEGRTLEDPRRPCIYSDQQYLRSPAEMAELFADLPEALENSVEIARRCNIELKITDLDPLAHELLFERFPNPERVSMPDFDVDFCMEGRDRVIEYVAGRYGRDSVSQIIT